MKPWDKRNGESARAWAAFLVYRDMPPTDRSLLGAYRLYRGRPEARNATGYFMAWAHRHEWHFRADQYDAHVIALAQRHIERRVGARAAQLGVIADALLGAAATELRRRLAMLQREDVDDRLLSPLGSIARAVEVARDTGMAADREAVERVGEGAVAARTVDPKQARDELLRRLEGISMHAEAAAAMLPPAPQTKEAKR